VSNLAQEPNHRIRAHKLRLLRRFRELPPEAGSSGYSLIIFIAHAADVTLIAFPKRASAASMPGSSGV
jgi:hypothetical protein